VVPRMATGFIAESPGDSPEMWLPESLLIGLPVELQPTLRELQRELTTVLAAMGLGNRKPVPAELATAALIEDLERLAALADQARDGQHGQPLAGVIALGHAAESLENLTRQLRGWLRGMP
jgi:hypothetical protein